MPDIHPTAAVDAQARLGDSVVVGPGAVIEAGVEIGDGCTIGAHVVIHSRVRLGRGNRLHPNVVLGGTPQDVSFQEAETRLEIGDDNVLREGVTLHRATRADRPTRLGSGCFLMAYAHLGHDCQVGDKVVMTNGVALGGHVEVGDRVVFGGGAMVHQFCRIGTLAMISGLAGISQDVLPYALAHGNHARHVRLNTVGLRRAGIGGERYRAIEKAFRRLRQGARDLDGLETTPEIEHLRAWLAAPSKRGLSGFLRRQADLP